MCRYPGEEEGSLEIGTTQPLVWTVDICMGSAQVAFPIFSSLSEHLLPRIVGSGDSFQIFIDPPEHVRAAGICRPYLVLWFGCR